MYLFFLLFITSACVCNFFLSIFYYFGCCYSLFVFLASQSSFSVLFVSYLFFFTSPPSFLTYVNIQKNKKLEPIFLYIYIYIHILLNHNQSFSVDLFLFQYVGFLFNKIESCNMRSCIFLIDVSSSLLTKKLARLKLTNGDCVSLTNGGRHTAWGSGGGVCVCVVWCA